MATLKDIAEMSGLHISTVSKALRDSSDINYETKLLVKNIAKKLNYKISKQINTDTQGAGSNIIGIICPEIESNYYAHLLSAVENKVKSEGYSVIVGFTDFSEENENYYINHMINSNVAGIIFISEGDNLETLINNYIARTEIPMVLISSNTETQKLDCIRIDDSFSVRLVIDHLLSLGHKKICYIGDKFVNVRLNTFLEILKENNINIEKNWIKTSTERFEKCGYEEMKNILKGPEIPTALFAAYDDIAIGAIKAINERGLFVPEDISVVGIDNIRVTEYLTQELTTASGPINEMGAIAANLLFTKINNKNNKIIQNIKLAPTIHIRKSTAPI